ncbi:protein CREG1-like [Salvia divinorum]|uniref:Protein CREG1-like n=1 Tax=Salvia divinorum TaxID=28513 RepID=A0ABD1HZ37_SALDI
MAGRRSSSLALSMVILLAVLSTASATGRPDVDDVPRFARWLVSQGKWGVIGIHRASAPFTYPASYTDARRGIPLFFLSQLDPVGRGYTLDARASFTISEISVNDCSGSDPQSPSCAKITLSGQLIQLAADSKEESKAKKALFKAHPEFAGFPNLNGTFSVYKLDIGDIFLVNKPAPARNLTVEAYLEA